MSAIAFGATFALFVAVTLVIFESIKSLVLENGSQQVGKFISWSFNERVTESTSQCFTFDSCGQQSVQRVISLFEREVVWSEQSSYVLHFISPLFDHFVIFGFSAIGFSSAVRFPYLSSGTRTLPFLWRASPMAVLAPGTRILAQYSNAIRGSLA